MTPNPQLRNSVYDTLADPGDRVRFEGSPIVHIVVERKTGSQWLRVACRMAHVAAMFERHNINPGAVTCPMCLGSR